MRQGGRHRLKPQAGSEKGNESDRAGPVRAPDEVLRLAEVERPSIADDEVLVRVRAASVHPDVWHVVRGLPYVRISCRR